MYSQPLPDVIKYRDLPPSLKGRAILTSLRRACEVDKPIIFLINSEGLGVNVIVYKEQNLLGETEYKVQMPDNRIRKVSGRAGVVLVL